MRKNFVVSVLVVLGIILIGFFLVKYNFKKENLNLQQNPSLVEIQNQDGKITPYLGDDLQGKLDKLTDKELVFGTTKINFKVFSEDISVAQVTVSDDAKKLNIVYKVPGIDFGLLYMTKYQNGNLYLTTRTDCPIKIFFNQYVANDCGENWGQQIMVYSPENPKGRVLYSGRGLGQYLISEDDKYIAVAFQEDNPEYGDILILDFNGTLVKKYTNKDVGFDRYIEPILWKGNTLYVTSSGPGDLGGKIAFIDTKSDEIISYNSIPDFNGGKISSDFKRIAYTDYPFFVDVESRDTWVKSSNNLVNLFVYDLNSKTQTKIATGTAWEFDFSWLDSKTLQYNEPITGKLITKSLD